MADIGGFHLTRFRGAGAAIVHERLRTGVSSDGRRVSIFTPDDYHYIEGIDAADPDVAAVRGSEGQGGSGFGVPGAMTYRFRFAYR